MRIAVLTKEWPPEIYGGAGVHVDELVPQLQKLADVEVHCFGVPRDNAIAHEIPAELVDANAALATLGVDLSMAAAVTDVDVVHSHTWYANLAGHLAGLLNDVPHVITAHSLEPLRPWKAEQLGGGYRISSWAEAESYRNADAIIAVSNGMRNDVLASYPDVDPARVVVVHNGIDTEVYSPVDRPDVLAKHGIDVDRPFMLFVGRITRQKGLPHLLHAASKMDASAQLVLCASSPDTPELGVEVRSAVAALRAERGDDAVIWIEEMLPKEELIAVYSAARAFVCPSVYEPLGIVNLEAMACDTAVVASDVGGIPEVVVDGETGLLVHYDADDIDTFESDLAAAMNTLITDANRAAAMGKAGRQRAAAEFGWDCIAEKTLAVYQQAVAARS